MQVEIGVGVIDDRSLMDLRFRYDTGDLPPLQIGHCLEFELSEPMDDFVIIIEGLTWTHTGNSRLLVLYGGQTHGYMENILQMLRACPFVSDITWKKERDL